MLTDRTVRLAKESDKMADSGGLYLYVSSAGSKTWRFDFWATHRLLP